MPILINQSVSPVSAPGVTTDVVLQPGSVISARVLQLLGNDQVRIAIGSQSIDVLTQVPLQAGQTLQLAVSQTADSIQLAVVNPQPDPSAAQAGNVSGSAVTLDQVTLAPSATASLQAQPGVTAAPQNQLTPQEQVAVSIAAENAATLQTSLAPLFANLNVAAALTNLPPQVQQAVAQVLARQTSLDPNLTGADVKQAFVNSGLFMEAHLASGSAPGSASGAATPDLKAALIVLRQVLTTSLNGAAATQGTPVTQGTLPTQGTTSPAVVPRTTAPALVPEHGPQPAIPGTLQPVILASEAPTLAPSAPAPQLVPGMADLAEQPVPQPATDVGLGAQIIALPLTPANVAARAAANTEALSLLQQTLQVGPSVAMSSAGLVFDDSLMLSLLPAATGMRPRTVDDAALARSNVPPPPIGGALPAAQPVMPATLVSNSPAETALHHLLADTDGAIARQTLLQVASLPDRIDSNVARLDPVTPRWNFEIPFATPQGTAVAQFEISRDGGGNTPDAARRVWRARFSLDVEPAGPVHALISLNGDKTSVRMWAERPATAAQLRAGTAQLSQALVRAELKPGDIVVQDGAPMQPAPAAAGHFLDRAL